MATVTIGVVCKELGLHADTVRAWVRAGRIPAFRPRRGRGWYRFDLESVRRAMGEMVVNAGPRRGKDGGVSESERIRAIEAAGAAEFWREYNGRKSNGESNHHE